MEPISGSGGPTALGRRQRFGGSDYLTAYQGGPYRLRVDTPWEKASWQPRREGTPSEASVPGTAVAIGGELFEVVSVDPPSEQVERYRYYLAAWTGEPAASPLLYEREACEAEEAVRQVAARQEKLDGTVHLLTPFAGLLPAEVQVRLEGGLDVSALRMSEVSARTCLILAGTLELLGLAVKVAGGFGWLYVVERLLPLNGIFLVESAVRLAMARLAGEPMGSLPFVLAYALVRPFRALRRGESLSVALGVEKQDELRRQAAAGVASLAPDDVRPVVDGAAGWLEVTSLLPKEHWTLRTVIWIAQVSYRLDRRELLTTDLGETRHRFTLRPAPPDPSFTSVTHYRPEEVRDLAREELRKRRQTWVQTFSQVWGLLDGELQGELAKVYRYSPVASSAWAIAGVAVVAGLVGRVSLAFWLRPTGGPADLVMLLVAAFFGLECLRRLLALRGGVMPASALGAFVRPFARRLLVF